jgi:hypothetical protein
MQLYLNKHLQLNSRSVRLLHQAAVIGFQVTHERPQTKSKDNLTNSTKENK